MDFVQIMGWGGVGAFLNARYEHSHGVEQGAHRAPGQDVPTQVPGALQLWVLVLLPGGKE